MPYHITISLLLFITITLLPPTSSNKCPDPDDLQPCSCWPATGPEGGPPRTLCQNLEQVEELKKVFSATGDHPFMDFEVSESVLSYFPASALREKAVRELVLQGVNLVGLFDRMPEPNKKLKSINVVRSKIFRGMEWPLLRNLNNLTGLFIEGVTIRSLGKEFMDNVPKSLTQFVLANNKLSRLNDRVFGRLTELTTLSLMEGRIRTLKRSMFPASSLIENMSFKMNQLSELPDNIFSDMPKLQYLSLEKNQLTTIPETVFNEIGGRNIEMDFSGNNIKCDCKIRWTLKKGWNKLKAKCHSPNQFKDKALVSGVSDGDLDYCDDSE